MKASELMANHLDEMNIWSDSSCAVFHSKDGSWSLIHGRIPTLSLLMRWVHNRNGVWTETNCRHFIERANEVELRFYKMPAFGFDPVYTRNGVRDWLLKVIDRLENLTCSLPN